MKTSLRQPTVHFVHWILRLTVPISLESGGGWSHSWHVSSSHAVPVALFLRLLLTWKWYITGALQSAWQAMCFAQTTLYFTARAKETCSPDVTDGPRGSLSERPPALEQEWLFWMHWNKWVQVGNILENLFLLIWKAEIFFSPKSPMKTLSPCRPPPCALPVRCSQLKLLCFQGSWTSDHECPNNSTIFPGKTNH